jgi:hypothetical protein
MLSFVGSAAPIAAFVATKGGGRTGPAPGAKRRAEAKRRMAETGYFVSRCKAPKGRRKIAGRSHCRPGRLPQMSPSQKAVGAVLSDQGKRRNPTRREIGAAADPTAHFRITPAIP